MPIRENISHNMSYNEALQWLTELRIERINHDRFRAGQEEAKKEYLAKALSSLKGDDLRLALNRYE